MDVVLESMLVLACLMLIVISIGPQGIAFWATWLKSKLTLSRKTKTDHTVSDSRDS